MHHVYSHGVVGGHRFEPQISHSVAILRWFLEFVCILALWSLHQFGLIPSNSINIVLLSSSNQSLLLPALPTPLIHRSPLAYTMPLIICKEYREFFRCVVTMVNLILQLECHGEYIKE